MKKDFKIIHDLGNLSNEERTQYLRAASEYFGLDPDLNALDTIWMNAEDGIKRLVAYARKGTTDILRKINGIEIVSLEQRDGPGYVSFIATGKDAGGRQEIAVGTHSIEGLKGERLAASVMTAQTRALRRLTLQFVGGGILDVSEVNPQTSDIASSPASLAQLSGSPVVLPPPQVPPSPEPGKDVTKATVEYHVPLPPHVGETIVGVPISKIEDFNSYPTFTQLVKELPEDHPMVVAVKAEAAKPAEPKKRGRKKKNTVDIQSPGQQTEMPVANIDKNDNLTPTVETFRQLKSELLVVALPPGDIIVEIAPETVAMLKTEVPVEGLPTEAQIEEYKKRFSKFGQEVLAQQGKMMPTEGIGGYPAKARLFALKMFGKTGDVKKVLTVENWDELFSFMEGYAKNSGAEALVKYINDFIGVAS